MSQSDKNKDGVGKLDLDKGSDNHKYAMGRGIAIGISVGSALGVAKGNVPVGIGFGIAIGVALSASFRHQREKS